MKHVRVPVMLPQQKNQTPGDIGGPESLAPNLLVNASFETPSSYRGLGKILSNNLLAGGIRSVVGSDAGGLNTLLDTSFDSLVLGTTLSLSLFDAKGARLLGESVRPLAMTDAEGDVLLYDKPLAAHLPYVGSYSHYGAWGVMDEQGDHYTSLNVRRYTLSYQQLDPDTTKGYFPYGRFFLWGAVYVKTVWGKFLCYVTPYRVYDSLSDKGKAISVNSQFFPGGSLKPFPLIDLFIHQPTTKPLASSPAVYAGTLSQNDPTLELVGMPTSYSIGLNGRFIVPTFKPGINPVLFQDRLFGILAPYGRGVARFRVDTYSEVLGESGDVIVYTEPGWANVAGPDNYLKPGQPSGDVTALIVSGNGVLVFFSDGASYLTGRGPPYVAQPFPAAIGCDKGVVPCKIGSDVYTIWHGEVYAVSGATATLISRPAWLRQEPFTEIYADLRLRHIVVRTSSGARQRYDTITGGWSTESALPVALSSHGAPLALQSGDDRAVLYVERQPVSSAPASIFSGISPPTEPTIYDLDKGEELPNVTQNWPTLTLGKFRGETMLLDPDNLVWENEGKAGAEGQLKGTRTSVLASGIGGRPSVFMQTQKDQPGPRLAHYDYFYYIPPLANNIWMTIWGVGQVKITSPADKFPTIHLASIYQGPEDFFVNPPSPIVALRVVYETNTATKPSLELLVSNHGLSSTSDSRFRQFSTIDLSKPFVYELRYNFFSGRIGYSINGVLRGDYACNALNTSNIDAFNVQLVAGAYDRPLLGGDSLNLGFMASYQFAFSPSQRASMYDYLSKLYKIS